MRTAAPPTQLPNAGSDRPSGPARLGHRPGLDALRGIAVASIVAYHADPGWFPLAPASLDVFFVLSTFLVTTVLLDSLARRDAPEGRRFFTRRARRLAAGLFAMVAVVLVLLAAGAFGNPATGRTALGAVLLHANVAQFSGDYFAGFAERNPLEHTWSLSVEEHFYLATFLAVALLWWLTGRNLRATRIGLLSVSAAVAVWSVLSAGHLVERGASPNRIYMGTDTRAVAAALGVALAAGLRGRWDLGGVLGRRLAMTGAAAVIVVAALSLPFGWHPDLEWYATGGWIVTALAGGVLLLAALPGRTPGVVSGNPVLGWAGRRSYGIYLWHLPLLVLLWDLGAPGVALALLGTCLAAEASHHLVERHFRGDTTGGGRLADRTFALGALAVAAVIALSAALVPEPDLPDWASPPTATDREPPPVVAGTTSSPGMPDAAKPLAVTVWGDSTAELLGARLAADDRFEVSTVAHPECTTAGSCRELAPPAPADEAAAVVVAIRDVAPFHDPLTDPLDIAGPERVAAEVWLSWSVATAGTPVALGMSPEARRDLGVGLHLRRMAADDPSNMVLGAVPEQWPDALVDRFAAEAAVTKVLLVGDSVAYSLGTAFRPEGSVVWDQSRHGCDPSPGDRVTERGGRDRSDPACDWRNDWLSAVQRWDPDVVVWHTGTWSTYDRHLDGELLEVGTDRWHRATAAAHGEAMDVLGSGGARVVVAIVAPAWETAPDKPIETRPQESARRMPALLAAVRQAAATRPAVEVLDTAEAICDTGCDRPDLREDGVHYSPEGAEVVARWISGRTFP